MDNLVKPMWLAALRSGEYAQGRNQLKNGDNYCCLGVLCDLYRKVSKDAKWKDGYFDDGETRYSQLPPHSVMEWAGLDLLNPLVRPRKDGSPKTLSSLNDAGMSFRKIANLIERQL